MSSTVKNIIILVVVAVALVLIYWFFLKGSDSADQNLVSSQPSSSLPSDTNTPTTASTGGSFSNGDLLSVLLSVKSLKLNDTIFSNKAFLGLHDSSIVINSSPGDQGRSNPFAPIGNEVPENTTLLNPTPVIDTTTATVGSPTDTPPGVPDSTLNNSTPENGSSPSATNPPSTSNDSTNTKTP